MPIVNLDIMIWCTSIEANVNEKNMVSLTVFSPNNAQNVSSQSSTLVNDDLLSAPMTMDKKI